MKNGLQRLFFVVLIMAAVAVLSRAPSRGGFAAIQRAQQTVYILVNVTGIARDSAHSEPTPGPIAARFALRAKGSQPSVDSEVLDGETELVAQAAQSAVRVQAEVTPNPNATLLVTNQSNVTLNGTAGTTITQKCVYTVSSNANSVASWSIKQGLASNFSSSWPGNDLANNSYLQSGTPQPTSTPFVVYPSNWVIMASNGHQQTYCVDLTLTIPSNVTTGAYSTTAVYTIWY